MTEKQLLEKENISSANSKTCSGGNTLSNIQYSAVSSSLPRLDIFMEDTLVNIKPAKPLTKREAEILTKVDDMSEGDCIAVLDEEGHTEGWN